jgi:hypothetical protein
MPDQNSTRKGKQKAVSPDPEPKPIKRRKRVADNVPHPMDDAPHGNEPNEAPENRELKNLRACFRERVGNLTEALAEDDGRTLAERAFPSSSWRRRRILLEEQPASLTDVATKLSKASTGLPLFRVCGPSAENWSQQVRKKT